MLAHLIYFACCYIYITKDIHTLQTKIVLEVEVFIKFPPQSINEASVNRSSPHFANNNRQYSFVSKEDAFCPLQVYLGRKVIHWTHTVIFYVLLLYFIWLWSVIPAETNTFLPWLFALLLNYLWDYPSFGTARCVKEPRILTGPAP